MARNPSPDYLDRAKKLTREEAEQVFSRMRRRMLRRLDDKELSPLEAVALALQKEDEDLEEWRKQWAKISARDEKKKNK